MISTSYLMTIATKREPALLVTLQIDSTIWGLNLGTRGYWLPKKYTKRASAEIRNAA